MEKENEIKGEWRAGIYDYGMFVENMRKLDSMRKTKSGSEEFEKTAAAALGIFSGFIAGLVALNYNGSYDDPISHVTFAFCIFCFFTLLIGAIVLVILQALPKKDSERAWLDTLRKDGAVVRTCHKNTKACKTGKEQAEDI